MLGGIRTSKHPTPMVRLKKSQGIPCWRGIAIHCQTHEMASGPRYIPGARPWDFWTINNMNPTATATKKTLQTHTFLQMCQKTWWPLILRNGMTWIARVNGQKYMVNWSFWTPLSGVISPYLWPAGKNRNKFKLYCKAEPCIYIFRNPFVSVKYLVAK